VTIYLCEYWMACNEAQWDRGVEAFRTAKGAASFRQIKRDQGYSAYVMVVELLD
jgi:hypothetical protein